MNVMQKMWSFSTLQRPTQEEKERRRRWRNENGHIPPDVKATDSSRTKKILRAKTFRHHQSNDGLLDYNDNLDNILASLPQNQTPSNNSFVEALRHRAKSTSRVNDYYDGPTSRGGHKPRREQSIGGFVSRLRFLDNDNTDHHHQSSKKALWQQQQQQPDSRVISGEGGNSSGYSSGGRPDPNEATSDEPFASNEDSGPFDMYAMTTTMQRRKLQHKPTKKRYDERDPIAGYCSSL